LGAVFFSIWAYPTKYQGQFGKRTLDLIDSVYAQAERHPDRMMMCFSVDDIQHKLAALMGIEGGDSYRKRFVHVAGLLPARRAVHDANLGAIRTNGQIQAEISRVQMSFIIMDSPSLVEQSCWK